MEQKMQFSDILKYVNVSASVLKKFKQLLVIKIKAYMQNNPLLLGGPGKIVQVDETMLNFKVK